MQVYDWLPVWLLVVIEPHRLHWPVYQVWTGWCWCTMSLLCHYYVTNKYKRNKPTFVCHHIERWGQKSYQNFFKFAFLRLSPCLSYTWIVETVKYFVFHSKMNHFIRNIAGILRFLLYTKFECIMISILSTEFMECKNLIHFSILF